MTAAVGGIRTVEAALTAPIIRCSREEGCSWQLAVCPKSRKEGKVFMLGLFLDWRLKGHELCLVAPIMG